jgi:ABC-type multidrug transport system ATPase subunit
MEEADFLSSKIGIMSKGVLRCLGTSMHLKQRYGRGFKLTISFYKASDRLAINQARKQQSMFDPLQVSILVESLLPRGKWQKLDQGGVQGTLTYEFEDSIDRLALLMDEIEKYKEEWGIEDWGISQTSLEEVFLNIVKEEDVQATI